MRSLMTELLIVNQYASTPKQPGHTRHFDFAVELVKSGINTRIFASSLNLATRDSVCHIDGFWQEEVIRGVRFAWLKSSRYRRNDWRRFINMLSFGYVVYKAGTARKPRPDIIIGSSPTLFAAAAAYLLAKRIRARFVLEIRDLWPQTFVDMGHYSQNNPLIRLLQILEHYLYRQADLIIILARGSGDYLRRRGVKSSKIIYIPNGVRLEDFTTPIDRETARGKYNFSGFTIIYTGAHGPANGLDVILEAAAELRAVENLEFVLVGDGTLKQELRDKARAMKLTNVRFLDPVPKSEIPALLSAADAAVMPLTGAGVFAYAVSPNKLFDYLAAKKPVLCTVPGETAELIEKHHCGYASPPEDGKGLANNVRRLLSLPARERDQMGENGYTLILNHYSRHKLADQLRETILQLSQPAESPGPG
jgi:glycosyltransferase involved in cell wall biosynthesis